MGCYIVLRTDQGLWTVGTYIPNEEDNDNPYFLSLRDFDSKAGAFAFIHYLNGGRLVE